MVFLNPEAMPSLLIKKTYVCLFHTFYRQYLQLIIEATQGQHNLLFDRFYSLNKVFKQVNNVQNFITHNSRNVQLQMVACYYSNRDELGTPTTRFLVEHEGA